MNTPWSHPRASSRATGKPAAPRSAFARCATSGAPGASSPFRQLSLERVGDLADATVVLYGAGSDGKPYADTAKLLKSNVFKSLPAAKAGHVYPLRSWFAYCYQDALVQLASLEAACRRLA